jgi:hypothetical protein
MTDKPEQTPQMQLDEPQNTQQAAGEADPQAGMAEILAELQKVGVKNPEQVANMARASSEAGRLANMLGEIRRENAELRRIVEQGQTRQPKSDWDGSPDTVDLAKLVENASAKAVRGFYEENVLKPQMQARQMFYQQMEEVQGDDDYAVVKDVFEAHLQNPRTQSALSSGEATISGEYNKLVRKFYRQLADKSRVVLESFQKAGAKPGAKSPPHMESGTGSAYVPPEQRADQKAKLLDLKSKSRGRDDDIDAMLKTMFPDDDPFLSRRR